MTHKERCPCRKRRLLASWEEGESVVAVLAPKAEVGYTFLIPQSSRGGSYAGVPLPGSGRCARRLCRLLRRA